ncbi:hypothetical protein HMPREF9439_01233 [Parasutterella excrementihominis YIT 11859]|uniref:Uncharacterized protein n=1 Tax=Parasutterella excrementihominis YIT 11859 TaxID=762966 RepID=F3QJX6_9BURK|nr:hypothetical protein HMPREF9439_01233 [Parasutterella excrementihominis YIT 11859]
MTRHNVLPCQSRFALVTGLDGFSFILRRKNSRRRPARHGQSSRFSLPESFGF